MNTDTINIHFIIIIIIILPSWGDGSTDTGGAQTLPIIVKSNAITVTTVSLSTMTPL